MGKYEVGVLGNFDGKIGTVVGARWKGITYMRHKGRKSTKPPTASQLDKQAKFAMVAKFANKFRKLLMAGYPDTTEQTQINQAVSEIYRKAVTGSYPAYSLVYSKVSLSKGELHNATIPTAVAAGGGIIKFTWTDNTDDNGAMADDKAILAVYCPELEQSLFKLGGAHRSAGADILNVANFTGKLVETWVSFISADGKTAATSIYTGQLTVS